jgi:hypothetical protein
VHPRMSKRWAWRDQCLPPNVRVNIARGFWANLHLNCLVANVILVPCGILLELHLLGP